MASNATTALAAKTKASKAWMAIIRNFPWLDGLFERRRQVGEAGQIDRDPWQRH